jgi:two-component sensor histidine kinase
MKRAKPSKPIIGENLLYFLVWSAVLLVPILNSRMMEEEHIYLVNVLIVWSKLAPYIFIFLVNNNILAPKLLLKRHYASYLLISFALLSAMFLALEYYQESLRAIPYGGDDIYVIHGKASFTDLAWYWNVLLGLFMFGANSAIKMMFKSIQDDQKIMALEQHSLRAEMDYLKYQINPHFFMNTLNNIHALIDIDPSAAQETVIELSKMMRYVLYDSERAEIDLVHDLEFVDNYIKLMKIRYTDNVDIRVNVQKPIPLNVKLPPLIFIVLVENAFKHGVSYNQPSYVYIDVSFNEGMICGRVENSRFENNQGERRASGMGLENIRKRLNLLFGSNYSLKIDDSQYDKYCVELMVPLKYD